MKEYEYVVFVNSFNNKVTIHKSTCPKYLDRLKDKTYSGYWHESFTDYAAARRFSESAAKRVEFCILCGT